MSIYIAVEDGKKSVDLDWVYNQCSTLRERIVDNPIFKIRDMGMTFEFGGNVPACVVLRADGVEETDEVKGALSEMAIWSFG